MVLLSLHIIHWFSEVAVFRSSSAVFPVHVFFGSTGERALFLHGKCLPGVLGADKLRHVGPLGGEGLSEREVHALVAVVSHDVTSSNELRPQDSPQ